MRERWDRGGGCRADEVDTGAVASVEFGRDTRGERGRMAAASQEPYYRVRFAEGYIFRMHARSISELKEKIASHYWWGEQKPDKGIIKLQLKSRKSDPKVWYVVDAPGYPKLEYDHNDSF